MRTSMTVVAAPRIGMYRPASAYSAHKNANVIAHVGVVSTLAG
jgi:hypothetical protein